ncbi:hypothetical protein KFE25_013812 [Diacronema lutheri]|uniref:Lipocalin/cytosolic fatty-acid binding domain-containing protein n=1 Tax=Diacronema lutheri TaxID=2081491 RepID=A0A8J6CDM0_DIALT|nr:hypothetical protein KFE25_013812 [Diacronema lutheri]
MRGCAWLALAAVRTVAAARRGSAHALGTATGCPPAGFDSVANFSLARYIAASPWYVIAQLPISFQPVSELYCVRATYVQANETIYVFNEARRGAVDGEPIAEADLVAHQDDLPEASANARTADSKLRVGLRYYAFVYQNSSAPHAQRAVASNLVSQMADDEERLGPDAKRRELLDFLKRYLFGPYWVVDVSDVYDWAIVTGGPPSVPTSNGLCTTLTAGFNDIGVWLLHRNPQPPADVVRKMHSRARELGLDTSALQDVAQDGCEYTAPCARAAVRAPWCKESLRASDGGAAAGRTRSHAARSAKAAASSRLETWARVDART